MKSRLTLDWIRGAAAALTVGALALGALLLAPASPIAAAAAPPITVPFDHLSTGFELDGVHRDLPCESCHLNAIFKGTPRNCGVCHIQGSTFNATPKTATHIQSTNNCAACHNTTSFRPQVHFDHAEVMGSCVSCHNGTIATGKDPKLHPQTNDACEACHTVMSWNPPKAVDHAQIPLAVAGFCIICHNGVAATGKNKGHVVTALECGDCHLTSTWLGANFDHTNIRSGCFSCHNGVKAVGKHGSHMPTTNTCEDCHTTGLGTKTPSWAPSGFAHTQMTVTTCQTCHSGSVKITTGFVTGQPANHVPPIPSTIDCGVCHGNNPAAETWTVLAASIAVLHTGLNVSNCVLCHGGQTFAGVPAPYIPMSISGLSPTKKTPLAPPHIPILAGTDCSACHGAAYQAGGFGPATAMNAAKHAFVSTTCDTCHDTGKSFYVGAGTPLQLRPADHVNSNDLRATADCAACHETKDWVSTALPAGHMPNPANLSCVTCHTKSPTDYTPLTLAANSVLHTGIRANCGLCHGDTNTVLTWYNMYIPKDAVLTPAHIPYLAGTDCSSCHVSSTYAIGTFGPMNMTQAKHAFVPTACNTCHEAGLTFTMGAASPLLQGRPADHNTGQMVAPNDCSICHTTANWNSNALPVGHMPNPGNAACTICHTDLTNYKTLASVAILHTGVTGSCGTCHGGTTVLTWYNNFTPKDALLTPSHIPYLSGADCSSCHATNYVTGGFGPTNMSAAKHAFVPTTCDTCHEAGSNFYLGASTPVLQVRPASHLSSSNPQEVSGDCSGCHNTTDWTTTAKPANHMPTPGTQTCSVCHTAIGTTEASYATLTASMPTMHTGITGNCGACHGAYTAPLTWYNNYTPKDAILAGLPHIPYLTGTDCSSCHAATYAVNGFGPATAMSPAKHAFVPTTCDTCHDTGPKYYVGSGTALQLRPANHVTAPNPASQKTGDCSLCHNTTVWTTPTTLPNNHMPIPGTQVCSVCHTGNLSTIAGYATMASIPILHTGITTGCVQCHGGPLPLTFYNNNDNPKAAPANHIPSFTNNDCSACHKANYVAGGFGPMNMTAATHTNVSTMACKTCHEAGLSFFMGAASPGLQGRPADHTSTSMAAPNDCAGCHTTANWNSNTMPAGHMPNPANTACNVCHVTAPASYKTFAANSILHTGISGGCAQCHGITQLSFYNNDLVVKSGALAPAHIPYLPGSDCSACHKSASYAAGTFGPMNMTQGTHAFVSATCNTCHGTATVSFYIGAASPGMQLRPVDHTTGTMLTGDCGGCHTTANWNSNSLPANHMPNPSNLACAVCHTGAPANYKVFAANSVLHTGITSNCSQCHGAGIQLSFANNDMVIKDNVLSPAHIPYLAGADCGACHKSTTYNAGTFGPMNMTQATHSSVSTNCVTCHEKGLSFYMGAASPALQGRPADHTSTSMAAPNNCAGCHTTANWSSTSGALPTGHMPNLANLGCATCHIAAPTNYATMASNAILHTGITKSCITCHGQTQLSFYNNNDPPKPMVANHIPSAATPCESCHAISFTTFSGTTMSASKHTQLLANTGGTCDQCHDTGKSFFGVSNLTTRPNNHHVGQDCKGCHSPNDWGGGNAKRTVAAATTPARATIGTVVSAPANAKGPIRPAAPLFGTQTGLVATGTGPFGNTVMGAAVAGTTTAAAPQFTHIGVTSNCVSCHNGTLAQGKGPAHIASNSTCENCHTTIAWIPARFDHRGVTASCISCHNGVSALGKPAKHLQTSQDCAACHGTIAWTPATFNHLGVNASCQSCHNGISATGKQAQHPRTTLDCGTCHNTLNWTVTTPPQPLRPLLPRPRSSTAPAAPALGPTK